LSFRAIGSLDLTYAGSYLQRHDDGVSDYSDYSYFYDVYYGQVNHNDAGQVIDPSQYIQAKGERFYLMSHELRLARTDQAPAVPGRSVHGAAGTPDLALLQRQRFGGVGDPCRGRKGHGG
jgi:hypothetical protein